MNIDLSSINNSQSSIVNHKPSPLKLIMKKNILTLIVILLTYIGVSQPLYLPLNQEYNRTLQKQLYSPNTHFHTSIRPYYIPDIELAGINYDSIQQLLRIEKKLSPKWKQKTWNKLMNDDVATFIRKDYEIIANPLMNFNVGTSISPSGGGAAGGGVPLDGVPQAGEVPPEGARGRHPPKWTAKQHGPTPEDSNSKAA